MSLYVTVETGQNRALRSSFDTAGNHTALDVKRVVKSWRYSAINRVKTRRNNII